MKKFTSVKVESIKENVIVNRCEKLSETVHSGLIDLLMKEGYDISEGDDVNSLLIGLCNRISKEVVKNK